jgi:hypothetical protein
VVGDRGEGGLGLPRHVGVGVAVATFEDLDDPDAGQVEVVTWVTVGPVGVAVESEEEDEGAVDALVRNWSATSADLISSTVTRSNWSHSTPSNGMAA